MESIKFWYTFTDEKGDMPNLEVDMTVENEYGVHLQDVCETFGRFLTSVGFSTEKAAEYLKYYH